MCVEQTLETCTIRYSFCTHLERNFQTSRHKRKHILSVNKPQHPPPPQKISQPRKKFAPISEFFGAPFSTQKMSKNHPFNTNPLL